MLFYILASNATEFSRGQLFHSALMLQHRDEQQFSAASVIIAATADFIFILQALFFGPPLKNKDVYYLEVIFFFNLSDENYLDFSKLNLSNAL